MDGHWNLVYIPMTGNPHGGPLMDYCGGFPLFCHLQHCNGNIQNKTKGSIKVSPRLVASDVSAQIFPREVTGGFQYWSHKWTYSPLLSSSCFCLTVSSMLQVYKCNQRLNSKSWATRSCRGAIRHN